MVRNVWKPLEVLDPVNHQPAREALAAIAHFLINRDSAYTVAAVNATSRLFEFASAYIPGLEHPSMAEIENALENLKDRSDAQWANLLRALHINPKAGVTYAAMKLFSPFENETDETVLQFAAQVS